MRSQGTELGKKVNQGRMAEERRNVERSQIESVDEGWTRFKGTVADCTRDECDWRKGGGAVTNGGIKKLEK